MQIANSLASTGGTSHSLQLLKVACTVEKKETECVSSVSKGRPTEFLFTSFLSHLYNVKKLDSKPKGVDETSRISGCFSRNCFQENYFFLGNSYAWSLHDNLK